MSAAAPRWRDLETMEAPELRTTVATCETSQHDRVVYFGLGILSLFACYTYTFPATYGDAAIYFPYFRGFFDLPFSYQPHHVSYGATSALHVVAFSAVYTLFGDYWLLAAKVINFLFVVAGVCVLFRTSRLRPVYFPLLCLTACCFETLLVSVAQLYEAGLAFLSMSLWLSWLRAGRNGRAILLTGLLPLVRPELGILGVVLFCDLVVRRRETHWLPWFALSLVPVGMYVGYMAAMGAGLLPASVLSRAMRSVEHRVSWGERLSQTFSELYTEQPAYVYALAVFLVCLVLRRERARCEWIAGAPLLALYVLFPPGTYMARYLTPILPVVILSTALLAAELWARSGWADSRLRWPGVARRVGQIALVLLVVAMVHNYWSRQATFQRYDLATWLLRDLAKELNPRTAADDKILIYEIQGQYSLRGYAISVDGTVGNDVQPVLLGTETMGDFIKRAPVKFVVTANAFAYRKIFDRSVLSDLYAFDLTAAVGDAVDLDGLRFRKILTNPFFADPSRYVSQHAPDLNVGQTLRVYGPHTPAWYRYQILWNSVFEVVSHE